MLALPHANHIAHRRHLYRKAKAEATRQGVPITRYFEKRLKLRLCQGSGARGAGRVVLPTFAAGKGFPYTPEELKALAQRPAKS
jgi:hypothetical protein